MSFYDYDVTCRGASGLIFIGNEIIVSQRDGNTRNHPYVLDLPGGTTEPGETPYETLVREVREEVGLHLIDANIHYIRHYVRSESPHECTYFVVARLPHSRSVHFGHEGLGYRLTTVEAFLADGNGWPVHQEHVTDYLLWRRVLGLPLPK